MLTLSALAASSALAAAPSPAPPPVPLSRGEDHELAWFDGTWDELLAKAKEENRIVFVDFWTTWCGWCKRLDRDTLSDDAVVAELKDFLCFSIDAESHAGAPLARRFGVQGYPALVFLDPDGGERDFISGYLPPEHFLGEVRRVKRNEGTLAGLRKRIELEPDDLDARYELAVKYRGLKRTAEHAAQIAEIRRRDPQGMSVASRKLKLEELLEELAEKDYELGPLMTFLGEETDPGILYRGWYVAWKVEEYLRKVSDDEEEAAGHWRRFLHAGRVAWKYVPDRYVSSFGNSLAWSLYANRSRLADDDKAFALAVAKRAAAAAPEDASTLDTYACCLFLNGDAKEALRVLDRCIALEPTNDDWRARREEFGEAVASR